jgi:hypothetical protein
MTSFWCLVCVYIYIYIHMGRQLAISNHLRLHRLPFHPYQYPLFSLLRLTDIFLVDDKYYYVFSFHFPILICGHDIDNTLLIFIFIFLFN